ncbi:MAG: gliding motility-associated C-terminal domain-containing protein [Bacteroidetes bacterium]|nr:gliding motility-associated C-terminal domain-containing protein [Bacteroidota bacterium]
MKKYLFSCLVVLLSVCKNEVKAQTVSTTIHYTGFQACGGCTVCGTDYWCFNTASSYCGNTAACKTVTFTDPCPPGSIVTSVSVQYFSADCSGNSMSGSINGQTVPTVNEAGGGCPCSSNPCGQSAPTATSNFPCGLPGYINGGVNNFQLCTGTDVCVNQVVLIITYAPANEAVPAVAPTIGGPTPVCQGTPYNYSASSTNAASYSWTYPAGWTINSGQGTGSTNATPGSSGNITVVATNACGSNSATYPVVVNVPSTPAASANASPTTVCPGNPSTLTLSGGSLGTGATWQWHSGSCGGAVVGSGTSISVSPGSTTTYYVNAVGTCNTTACVPVTVNVGGTTATPGTPTGPSPVCSGSTQTYNTTGTVGATSYNWTVPGGATINSGQGTASISVTWGSTSGNVCVTATGPCGVSAAACTPVTVNLPPASPSAPAGTTNVCGGSTQTYNIPSVAGATSYNWTVPGGSTISSGQGTTSISVIIGSTSGNICVTATGACGTSPAACTPITVSPPLPTPSAPTGSTTVCSGTTQSYVTTPVAGATGYTWTVPTGATINSGQGTTSISVTWGVTSGNVCVTATGTCAASAAACTPVTVNITPVSPTPSGATTACSGSTQTYNTPSVPGATTYNWTVPLGATINSGQGTTSISVTWGTTGGNVCATATGACGTSAPGCVAVTITTPPAAPGPVTGTTSICSGLSANYSISSVAGATSYTWAVSGGVGISSGQGTTASTINWVTAGTYTVSVVAGNACGASPASSLVVNVNPVPTVTVNNATICSGGTATLTTGGANTYTWSTLSNATSINVSPVATATYAVLGMTVAGCTNTAVATVNVSPAPTLSLSASSYTICSGATQTFTVSGGSTYTWTPASTLNNPSMATPTSNATVTTIYTVGGTASGCAPSSPLTLTLTVNPVPTVTVNNATVCSGVAASLTAGGAVSYSWNTGSTSNPLSVSPSTTTSYTVTGTDANSCTNTAVANVTVNPNPTVTVNNASICSGGTATLTAGGANTYTWSSLSTGDSLIVNPTVSTSYTVLGMTAAGCTNTAVSNVTVGPVPTLTLTASSYTICSGATQTFTVSGASTYTWAPASTLSASNTANPTSNALTTTVYTVTGTASGCSPSAAQTLTLTVNTTPTVTVNSPTVCSGAASVLTANGADTYAWSTGATTNTISVNPTTTTSYTVVGTSTLGCVDSAIAVVSINTTPTITVNNVTVCAGITASLTANGAATYIWSTGSSSNPLNVNPTVTTTYTVIGASVAGCTNTAVGTVSVNPTPTVNLSGVAVDTAKCGQSNGGVNASSATVTGGTPSYTYQWYNGSTPIPGATSLTLTGQTGGTYSLQVTDANGCVASTTGGPSSYTVPSSAAVIAQLTANPATGNVPLSVTFANGSTGGTVYVWNYGDGSALSAQTSTVSTSHTYTAVGTYTTLLVAANQGCIDTARITIIANVATTIVIPNIFTPNGDGVNDNFFIINTGMSTLSCLIYNRWGELMATLTAPQQVWDGSAPNGDKAPDGTYMYILQAQGTNGKSYSQQGTVTLIR